MAVTNYYSIAGEVIAERTAGSARVDYLTDGLGSTTATVNQSAQVVNTYRYKPAGAQLAKTGIGPDPAFGWAGYLPTQKRFSEHYLRGRHVSDLIGVFTAKDQFISAVSPYAYALNNPVLFTDPMGWAPCQAQKPRTGQHPRTRPSDPYDPHTNCKDMSSPQACYECAVDYYYLERRLSPELACVLANRYCNTTVDCKHPFPPAPKPIAPPPQKLPPRQHGHRLFPAPPNTNPKPINAPGPLDPFTPLLPKWCRFAIQEACGEEPGNSMSGVLDPGSAGFAICIDVQRLIANLLIKYCGGDEESENRQFCLDLEQKQVAWAAWCSKFNSKS